MSGPCDWHSSGLLMEELGGLFDLKIPLLKKNELIPWSCNDASKFKNKESKTKLSGCVSASSRWAP